MTIKNKCYSYYFYTYYFLKSVYLSGKKKIKSCICPIQNDPLENICELKEVVNDNLPNIERNTNYNFKYINSSSSEEVIYEQPKRKIKRKNALKIRNKISGKNKFKKSSYKSFENKIPKEKNSEKQTIQEKNSEKQTIQEKNSEKQKTIIDSEEDWYILD
jgi:hypothetical protein